MGNSVTTAGYPNSLATTGPWAIEGGSHGCPVMLDVAQRGPHFAFGLVPRFFGRWTSLRGRSIAAPCRCSLAEPRGATTSRRRAAEPPPAASASASTAAAGASHAMPNLLSAAFMSVVGLVSGVLMPSRSGSVTRLRRAAELGKKTGGFAALAAAISALYHSWVVRVGVVLYVALVVLCLVSHRAQTWLIYLHWIRPHNAVGQPSDVCAHGIGGFARSLQVGHLRGWHLVPAGPPFARTSEDYETALAKPGARVIIFFHGNSGTRAFPRKRIRVVSTMAAHFRANVLAFDYSGFGDTPGRPSEDQLYADARTVYAYVRQMTAPNARIIIYGQSLGSFVAADLAAHLSDTRTRDVSDQRSISVILESAPSSLFDACKSHPTALLFRIIPGIDRLLRAVLKERLDSAEKIERMAFPLLVLHGDRDWMITPWQGRKLHDSASRGGNMNATLRMFPGCGHNNVFSDKDYLYTVNEFLEKHAPLA